MLYRNKIKRKYAIDKFKHELAWSFLLFKASIKHSLHFNEYIPLTIKEDIHNALENDKVFELSMKPYDNYKDLRSYLNNQYISNDELWKMLKHLFGYIEGKFGKYKDIKITYDHHVTYDNVIISIKLI